MDKETRNAIERATQRARKLLDEDFSSQLEGTFDVLRSGTVASKGGAHLSARQMFQRDKVAAAIEHKRVAGMTAVEAVTDYVRDAAFTALHRFIALKMLEARELVQECITKGEQSAGYREFCGMAPGLALLPDAAGYRLYVESLFDELSTEMKVLFDRRDAASVLWPKRQTFDALLAILNARELSEVWGEDETIGWVYQFFNSKEERQAMRDPKQGGSQAPRNSRELAVRNQFFTPRYVVQFLCDNTLGRLWLEMHGDKTRLVERCEYLVRSLDEVPQPRETKDPRDLRILDPACGSGHFLLYSFDLLLAIYEEAWGADSPVQAQENGRTLREDYPDLAALRRWAPALIVQNNLCGVDIDPRCAQIAALALWLRAQRAWKECGVAASERPRLRRTHIVVAEPIPGDAALVEEFAARLDPPLLRDLFKIMVSESRLAGELGTLLRAEDGIARELCDAREEFVRQRQATGFLPGLDPVPKQGTLNLSGIDDDHFFHEAEARIIEALRRFAETASGGVSVRRRLFAGDAAQGIALIDLARTRFDVVLMNPPFGAGSLAAKREFEAAYPRTKNDVYAAFVERGVQLLYPHGLLGAITSRTGFFLSSFQKWREEILLKEALPVVFADLGYGVLDSAMVEVAAYCLEKGPERSGMKTVFLRALEADDKAAALRAAIYEPDAAVRRQRFEVEAESFRAVPRSPFAYWVRGRLRQLFKELPPFEAEGRTAKQGLATADDFRFVRGWWAVPPSQLSKRWYPIVKGGRFSPYYANVPVVVNWRSDGSELKAWAGSLYNGSHWSRILKNTHLFLRPGLTWPLRGVRFSAQAVPRGSVFSVAGKMAFVEQKELPEFLALFNALAFDKFIAFFAGKVGGVQYEVGLIQSVPVPELNKPDRTRLQVLARRAWSLKCGLDTRTETSHAFTLPALLQVVDGTLAARAVAWTEHVRSIEVELTGIQAEIDERCFDLYGIDESDRRAITEGFGGGADESGEPDEADTEADVDDEGDADNGVDASSLIADLVSWAVGVAFGRFDVRLATGARALPDTPEPFEPLPVCSPAMLAGDDGLPLASAPFGYPIVFPKNGMLMDDPGHLGDLTAAVRAVFDEVFGVRADAWWDEAAALLYPKDPDLRAWLASSFFEHHLKRHSKSRRKAPILWQLGVLSGRYSVWLYAHRLTRDSFFQIQNDVVTPKLAHEERQLTSLVQNAGASPSAKERKEIAAHESLVEELRALLDEVKRVAPLWNPTLDDGVVLTMAPLWRLVPQHKPWQRELKAKWDELVAGKYDWAQLAMHLWPDRVVTKCAADRGLAIAHGLQDVFWAEAGDGKWKPRSVPKRPIQELVRERTSPAVQAAVNSLLEAPVATAGGSRGRGRRAAAAAD